MLKKAMYGTRDAPQIWQKEVQRTMESFGFTMSVLQPSVYYHREKDMIVVVHVDDFLCSGNVADLEWLYNSMKQKYDLKRSLMVKSDESEVRYLNRRIRWKEEKNYKQVRLMLYLSLSPAKQNNQWLHGQ